MGTVPAQPHFLYVGIERPDPVTTDNCKHLRTIMSDSKSIRLVIPQWQGGDNPAYGLGSKMLDWLAPETGMPVFHVSVREPNGPLPREDGITGRSDINSQLAETWEILTEQEPQRIATFGGDCLVSLAPFAWLSETYGDKLGVLWIDAHPDVQTADQYPNAHAHVLGALLGNGDADLTKMVARPLDPKRVMIAGIHHPLEHEERFLTQWGIGTCSPEEVKAGGDAVMDWIAANGIEQLAIHFDLDVLDPRNFRSVLFARPGRGEHDFGDVAEGRIDIPDALNLIERAGSRAEIVGLTIAEHLPWDAVNLRAMLARLPLVGNADP